MNNNNIISETSIIKSQKYMNATKKKSSNEDKKEYVPINEDNKINENNYFVQASINVKNNEKNYVNNKKMKKKIMYL